MALMVIPGHQTKKSNNKQPPPEIHNGFISYYEKRPTDATLAYRMEIGDVPNDKKYAVYIAALSCDDIGKEATLIVAGKSHNAMIFDCAGDDGGYNWMVEQNIVAEVDWYFQKSHPSIIGTRASLVIYNGNNRRK